ncbi:unnamed protein product [Mytilus coruscus]|uniref:B box-type domain-containing protein n=1 Tax=Mytilus coruscus TaxID=42192 RepID=A0A6J8F131_MYTCO|nr:unnamed protein product [Mytilus coruscus]
MASASGTVCGVCETQHVVKEAAFWCLDCDEGICTSCEKHHRASRQIPPIIASISQYCQGHNEIVKTSKNSALFEIKEQSLKEMKNNIERIVEDRRQNLEEIKQQRQRFQTDIREIRDKINTHLDKLEQEIQQDIQAAEQKVMSQIDSFVLKISDHGKTIDELKNNISATKSFATDLQTFFGGKMFEAKIKEEEKFIVSLIEDGSL